MAQIDDLERRVKTLEAEFNSLMNKPYKSDADDTRLWQIRNELLDIQAICKEHE